MDTPKMVLKKLEILEQKCNKRKNLWAENEVCKKSSEEFWWSKSTKNEKNMKFSLGQFQSETLKLYIQNRF